MALPPVKLDHLPAKDALRHLGEVARMGLQQYGACVLVMHAPGRVTVLDPRLLLSVPDEDIVEALLDLWTDSEIADYLSRREQERMRV